jgi:membrane-associated phospholipid phosphatase
VTEELRATGELESTGGPVYLTQLTSKVVSAAHVEYHARIVAQKYIQRELIRVATEIQNRSFDDTYDITELLDYSEDAIFQIAEGNIKREVAPINEVIKDAIQEIEEAGKREDALVGIPSGFTRLDRLTSGWQKSELIIIAARPSMGKTALALSIDNPLLKAIGLLIDNDFFYTALILAMVFVGENRNEKRLKILATLVVVVVVGVAIKGAMAHPRPCTGETGCPTDYSFPSMHAIAAFTLMIAFLNKRAYPLYLLFALFVSFTRLNLGVHVFVDIAAALPIALVGYYAVDMAWNAWKKKGGTGHGA